MAEPRRTQQKKRRSQPSGAKLPILGAHMSVAGGPHNAFHSGAAVGCDCLQIFVKNQRQWNAPALQGEQIAQFKAAQVETGLSPVVAHASYLLNLASPDAAARRKSVAALADELQRCDALGVQSLIFHPGACLDSTIRQGIRRIAASLDQVQRRVSACGTTILLETTAGQGTAIGHRFEHLRDILAAVSEPSRFGICLDTCHLFAAGYDFRTKEGYASVMHGLDRALGIEAVRCIHMNDSKRELSSRVDRHEHIGKGEIGKRGFAHFVNDPNFLGIPMILETPKGKDGRGADFDKLNLRLLRRLAGR